MSHKKCEQEMRGWSFMKKIALMLSFLLLASVASAAVTVRVVDVNGLAAITYECTDGDVVRAFGLDVTVNTGTITGINGFHRGESTADSPGYGIFPGAFASSITVDPNTGEVSDWNVADYTPVANPLIYPEDTLGGLGTPGVTLELGGLWAISDPAAQPPSTGTLCTLSLSNTATVTIKANRTRAGETGIVLVDPGEAPTVVFAGATVTPQN